MHYSGKDTVAPIHRIIASIFSNFYVKLVLTKAFRFSSKNEFVQSEKNCQMKALSIIVEYFYFGNIATCDSFLIL